MSSTQPVAVQPLPRGGAARLVGRRARDWIPAAIVLVAAIAAWQGGVRAFHVQRFLLPAPSAIWTAFKGNQHALWQEGWWTLQEALGGFALGCGIAILLAIVVACLLGIGFYLAVVLAERVAMRWQPPAELEAQ